MRYIFTNIDNKMWMTRNNSEAGKIEGDNYPLYESVYVPVEALNFYQSDFKGLFHWGHMRSNSATDNNIGEIKENILSAFSADSFLNCDKEAENLSINLP